MIAAAATLVAAAGGLLALPLAPALLELKLRKDPGPLPIESNTESVTDLANSFRTLLSREDRAIARRSAAAPAALVFERDAILDPSIFFADDIYAKKNLFSSRGDVFGAILCEADMQLAECNKVLRWVHAEGAADIEAGSILGGRLSAGKRVRLGRGCSFERVHAPTITIVRDAPEASVPYAAQLGEGCAIERVTDRVVVSKDFVLRSGEFLRTNVVAGRRIWLGERCCVMGSVKSNATMRIQRQTSIAGSLVSASDLHIGQDCCVMGPVLSEGELVIDSGTRIGTLEHPTTVRAARIRVAPGVTIHGTLWACEDGRVKG